MSEEIETKKLKLPYFHRTLSEDETKIIGDITPKRIDPETPTSSSSSSSSSTSSSISSGSAWNSANTWEERDYTPWAKDQIKALFSGFEDVSTDVFQVSFTDIDNVLGHANVTHSRGKPRYLYSFSFDLKLNFEVISSSQSFSVKVSVDDVISDVLEDIEIALEWSAGRPNAKDLSAANAFFTGKVFRQAIISKMKEFEAAYQSL